MQPKWPHLMVGWVFERISGTFALSMALRKIFVLMNTLIRTIAIYKIIRNEGW